MNDGLHARDAQRVISDKLMPKGFPRSATYDPMWILKNSMGPHPLWLMESLAQVMHLEAGMRVLDLGCGRAMTSVFLAREFGVEVVAADLWVDPSDNLVRLEAAGVSDRVLPLRLEAHDLPFASGSFDAVVSIDAYHYFGTDDLYLAEHLRRILKPGGQLGVVVPGTTTELSEPLPAHLAPHWRENHELWSFHSPQWWSTLWSRAGLVEMICADQVPGGAELWIAFDEASTELGTVAPQFADFVPKWIAMMKRDSGKNLGFTRLCAQVPEKAGA